MKTLLNNYIGLVRKAADDDNEQSRRYLLKLETNICNLCSPDFGTTPTNATYKAAGSIRRAGTVIRSPIEGRRDKNKDKSGDGELQASEVSLSTRLKSGLY